MTIVLVALIVVTAQASTPASLPGSACTPAALVGTWKVVEASQGGETIPTGPTDAVEYKHVTPTHFIVFQVAEGDDTWHISGDIAGTPIVETWKRVSADRKTP
jgi:hypothetical protein